MLYCFGVVRPAASHVFVKVIESVAAVPNSTYTELYKLKRFSMFYFINYLLWYPVFVPQIAGGFLPVWPAAVNVSLHAPSQRWERDFQHQDHTYMWQIKGSNHCVGPIIYHNIGSNNQSFSTKVDQSHRHKKLASGLKKNQYSSTHIDQAHTMGIRDNSFGTVPIEIFF